MRVRRSLATLALFATPLVAVPTTASADIAVSDLPDRAADTQRIAGEGRVETAANVAVSAYPSGADVVLLARADDFPDALAGSYLAGQEGAPLLLTNRTTLSAVTKAALTQLEASEVIVLGGTNAVSQAIEDGLVADGVAVRRVQGDDRFATAAAIAAAGTRYGTVPDSQDTEVRTALLATGRDFPDAIAAGSLAANGDLPLLLTNPGSLPAVTADALRDLDIEQVIVLGGSAAVSTAVADQLEAAGVEVDRIAGADRFETSAAIANRTSRLLRFTGSSVLLATGRKFPDALALAGLADVRDAAILLTDTDAVTRPAFGFLDDVCGTVGTVTVAGGTAVVTDQVLAQAALATACANITVPFAGSNEVGTAGDPDATGLVRLYGDDDDAGSLCYQLEVDGMEAANAAHIHAGVRDRTGPVVATLTAPSAKGISIGCLADADVPFAGGVAGLTDELVTAENGFYVNVHTSTFPAGAVRANLLHDDIRTLSGYLELDDTAVVTAGAPGVPATEGTFARGDLGATGNAEITLLDDRFCYSIFADGLSSPAVAAHLHRGAVDANGPVVATLDIGLPRTNFSSGGCVTLDDATRADLADGPEDFYVNVHSVDFPAGAMRGQAGSDLQLVASGQAESDGAGAFGAGDLDAAVVAEVLLGGDQAGTTVVCVELNGIGQPDDQAFQAGHVHAGAVDENGPVTLDLDLAGQRFQQTIRCSDQTTANVAALVAAPVEHYLNLHTVSFPSGAYRGQTAATSSTAMTGAQEVGDAGVDDPLGEATGSIFAAAADDTLCWAVVVDSLTSATNTLPVPSGLHVHQGAVGANGPVVLNLLAPATGFGSFRTDLGFGFGCIADETAVPAVLTGLPDHYLNLHTDLSTDAGDDRYVNGAVRGQLG